MKVLLALISIILPVMANLSYEQGQAYTSKLQNKTLAKTTSPNIVPGYTTDNPKEASLDAGSIGEAAVKESSSNKVSQSLKEISDTRESYKLDTKTNPLFLTADEVNKDPEKTMKEAIIQEAEEPDPGKVHTCEEGGEEYTQTCQRLLKITLKIVPGYHHKIPFCRGHWTNRLKNEKKYCNPKCELKDGAWVPKVVTVENEEWVNGCQVLEDLADKGVCRYSEKIESQKNETRMIQGEPVTRDHFEEKLIYSCSYPIKNTCLSLKVGGCQQVSSECKTKVNGRCVVWNQTYRCASSLQKKAKYHTLSTSSPFCLTGNCVDSSYEANDEMLDALTQLSIMKEVQTDIRTKVSIFKGEVKKCSKHCINFKDCCGTDKGWGTDIGMASCKPKEKQLVELRKEGKCVLVGTYCAKKEAGICLRKKTSFCCFGNKLSKIVQQQGRNQLALSWGDPENPDCRGLNPEELSKLDLSKMDLKELYEDIQNNYTKKPTSDMSKNLTLERVKENMKQKIEGFSK